MVHGPRAKAHKEWAVGHGLREWFVAVLAQAPSILGLEPRVTAVTIKDALLQAMGSCAEVLWA